jgi:molybdate transport system permease protein
MKTTRWLNRLASAIAGLAVITLLLFITLPILAVFLQVSPAQLWTELQDQTVIKAFAVSIFTTCVATGISFCVTVPTAYVLARRNFRGKNVVDTIMDIPFFLPPAVAGIALLYAFAPHGLLGPILTYFGIRVPGSTLAVILAQVFVASPFLLRSAKGAFQSLDQDVLNSAKILTSSKPRIFFTISLPLSKRQVTTGLAMTWARSLGEFGATMLFAGNLPGITQTLPLAIYAFLEFDVTGALVASVILIVFAFSVLLIVKYLESKPAGEGR